jgi:septal ring-binding cell division protein DamX
MRHSVTRPLKILCSLLAALLLVFSPSLLASVARVPVHLDAALLERLLVKQLFTGPDTSAELIDGDDCNRARLTQPGLAVDGEALRMDARLEARLGLSILGSCQQAVSWQGGIGVQGLPAVGPDGRSVRFQPTRTWLTEPDGTVTSSGPVWEVVDASLRTYFSRFTLDFSPQIESLAQMLPDFLPRRSAQQLRETVETLRLGSLEVTPTGLDAEISFQVEDISPPARPEGPLTDAELEQWESRWQMMDSLLVLAVKHYAAATEEPELQAALLDVLIDSRYQLRDALVATPTYADDPVRVWFLESWQRLGPLVQSIALEQPGQEWLQLLSLVTATDALQVLDRMGPGVGLDISTDGLRRLARLINEEGGEELLRYTEGVDPELVELFRRHLETAPAPASARRPGFSLFPRAWAATPAERLNSWSPQREELPDYLPLVGQLLESNATRTLSRHALDPEQQQVFRKLVLATAWQESCWRQYVVENSKLVPLRSGTGDVGLMQVNEKVWRGFYDIQKLRWDIDYNAGAGTQILLDYLVRYAIKQGEHRQPGGKSNLARASYSAYNGGPRQVARYRRSDVSKYQRKVDTAFWDKYRQVEAGRANQVAACLGGEPNSVALRTEKAAALKSQPRAAPDSRAQKDRSGPGVARPGDVIADVGRQWARSEPRDHYTLQLGAFSNPENASRFIREQAVPAPAYVYPRRKGSDTQYLVLHGSFASPASAEAGKRRFVQFKPWPRRFAELVD